MPLPGGFFFFSFFYFLLFLYHVFVFTVQELTCSACYCVNKTSISKLTHKRRTSIFRLQLWQILDTSANIRLTKQIKTSLYAKQHF